MPDNNNEKSSKKERKIPKEKDRSDDFLTPAEQRRLKEKYQEIKRRVKEEKQIMKTWEALEKIKRDETKRRLIKKARRVLDESSSEDRRRSKPQQQESSSESQRKQERNIK